MRAAAQDRETPHEGIELLRMPVRLGIEAVRRPCLTLQVLLQVAHRRRLQCLQRGFEVPARQRFAARLQLRFLVSQRLVVIVHLQGMENGQARIALGKRLGAENPEVEQQLDAILEADALLTQMG
ncbi:hypothetical protein D9M70_611540 [compost metagenome]